MAERLASSVVAPGVRCLVSWNFELFGWHLVGASAAAGRPQYAEAPGEQWRRTVCGRCCADGTGVAGIDDAHGGLHGAIVVRERIRNVASLVWTYAISPDRGGGIGTPPVSGDAGLSRLPLSRHVSWSIRIPQPHTRHRHRFCAQCAEQPAEFIVTPLQKGVAGCQHRLSDFYARRVVAVLIGEHDGAICLGPRMLKRRYQRFAGTEEVSGQNDKGFALAGGEQSANACARSAVGWAFTEYPVAIM